MQNSEKEPAVIQAGHAASADLLSRPPQGTHVGSGTQLPSSSWFFLNLPRCLPSVCPYLFSSGITFILQMSVSCRVSDNPQPTSSWVCHSLNSLQICLQQTSFAKFQLSCCLMRAPSGLAQTTYSLCQTNDRFCFCTEIFSNAAVFMVTIS